MPAGWNFTAPTTAADTTDLLKSLVAGIAGVNPALATVPIQVYRNQYFSQICGGNLLAADRRVAVELGCSLPIVDSPLVDHGKQSADITLGRWMFNPLARINATVRGDEMTFENAAPDVHELQNGTDRVQYHSLMPQDKIHFLRVKMYARLREYNIKTDKFDMNTVPYPMTKMDWWHARLHFVSKD
jgi:hypothetical protein